MSNSLITTSSLPTTTQTSQPQKEETINIFKSLKPKNKNTIKDVPITTKLKLSTLDTKSKMIRYLHKEGYNRQQIANILGISYQFANNVLTRTLKT